MHVCECLYACVCLCVSAVCVSAVCACLLVCMCICAYVCVCKKQNIWQASTISAGPSAMACAANKLNTTQRHMHLSFLYEWLSVKLLTQQRNYS